MNDGQTESRTGMVKNQHKAQKPTESDRFVHLDILQVSMHNAPMPEYKGVILTGQLVLSGRR
jgi:hypothetical protein